MQRGQGSGNENSRVKTNNAYMKRAVAQRLRNRGDMKQKMEQVTQHEFNFWAILTNLGETVHVHL